MACPSLLDFLLAAVHPTGFLLVVGLPIDFRPVDPIGSLLVVARPIGSLLAAGLPIDYCPDCPIHPVGFLVGPIDFPLVVDHPIGFPLAVHTDSNLDYPIHPADCLVGFLVVPTGFHPAAPTDYLLVGPTDCHLAVLPIDYL